MTTPQKEDFINEYVFPILLETLSMEEAINYLNNIQIPSNSEFYFNPDFIKYVIETNMNTFIISGWFLQKHNSKLYDVPEEIRKITDVIYTKQ